MCSGMVQHTNLLGATPIIRNTFIDYAKPIIVAKRRNKSLPPSFRLGEAQHDKRDELPPLSFGTVGSDDSTDVRTEASPRSGDTPSSDTGNLSSYEPSSKGYGHTAPCEPCAGMTYFTPSWPQTMGAEPILWMQPPQVAPVRLSSKTASYEPNHQATKSFSQTHVDSHTDMAETVEAVNKILQRSPKIATVDLTQNVDGWSLVVSPAKNTGVSGDHVLALAKRALLEAAEQSKSVYVLGYNSPDVAFAKKAQGFEARLVVMGNIRSACWRTFKQGSCHYGASCCKEHPILEVPVRVFLETAQFQYTATEQVVQYCNQEFASYLMMIITMLTSSTGVEVSLYDLGGEGWSIEIPVPGEYSNLREHLLLLARNAFTEASRRSKNVFVMGFGGAPFIPKPNGFVAMLGEMSDSKRACWDVYKMGLCSRDGCRWQHPQCLMPVSLVLKPVEAPAEDEYIADADAVLEALLE